MNKVSAMNHNPLARLIQAGAFSLTLLFGINYASAQNQLPGQLEIPSKTETLEEKEIVSASELQGEGPSQLPSCWLKNPPVRILPRPGFFSIPPKGAGYYSLVDCLHDNCRDKPPAYPYPAFGLMPQPFFDADFRYLDNPKNTEHDYLDCLHRIHLGDNWLFGTGGQVWWRHMHETNSRLSGMDNDYDLFRTRIYGDLWFRNAFRLYVEFVNAQSFNQDLPPLAIDRNFGDLQNAFIDVKIAEGGDHPAYVRVGRQELLFGSQRLVSPPDWAQTRRTFQGVRGFRQGEKLDVDLFWAQPVVPSADRFDSVDNNQNFAGLWTTYRPQKGHFIDLYYLFLDNTNQVTKEGIELAPYNVHTVGTRYAGDWNQILWDFEGMVQFGERGQQDIRAGSGTAGLGYHFAKQPMNPVFWAMYDYASGDTQPNAGSIFGTFNQLFPFGHYYFGWLDLVGRQNIQDFNMHLYLYPTKWITLWTQYHHFRLASQRDGLYNVAGTILRRDPTGQAGADVGQELDLICNVHVSRHTDVLFGWSKLWAGDFLKGTAASSSAARSPELFYVQFNYRW
jgi:hypothetical protein